MWGGLPTCRPLYKSNRSSRCPFHAPATGASWPVEVLQEALRLGLFEQHPGLVTAHVERGGGREHRRPPVGGGALGGDVSGGQPGRCPRQQVALVLRSLVAIPLTRL